MNTTLASHCYWTAAKPMPHPTQTRTSTEDHSKLPACRTAKLRQLLSTPSHSKICYFCTLNSVTTPQYWMNFLAHFYLDRDHPDSHFAVGAATPDLLSIYNSGLRIKAGHVDHLSADRQDQVHAGFLAGLARHFHADRVFHSSKLFSEETSFLSKMLQQRFPEQDVPRKYFVAHILLELLMDKVLIELHPNLLPTYYRHFEALVPFGVVRRGTEVVSSHALPNYEAFLMKFVENKYLYHYVEYDHLIYILRRLLRRVGIEQSTFLDDPRFPVLMQDFEIRIPTYYEDFFTEIRAKER